MIFFLFAEGTLAAENTLVLSASGEVRYDDNIAFSRIRNENDIIYVITPGAELSWKTDNVLFETGIRGIFSRYKDYDELDQDHFSLNAGGNANISERFSLNGSAARTKDSTLDSELSDTGVLTQRSDVDRDNLGLEFSYMLSEKSRMSLNSSYARNDYEYEGNVDYEGYSISLAFTRILGTEKDTLFLQPYYSENSSLFSSVKSAGLYAGWAGDISETLSLQVYTGARRSKTVYFIWEEKKWGWLADISLDKSGETWNAGISLKRDLNFSSLGDPIETDRLIIDFRKRLSEKFSYSISGSITGTESAGSFSRRDAMYYDINCAIRCMIGRDLFLRLSYRYSVSHDSLSALEKSIDRNMVTIGLFHNFQEKF